MTEEYSIDVSLKEININRFSVLDPGRNVEAYIGTLGLARAIEVARHEPRVYVRLVVKASLQPSGGSEESDRIDLGMLDMVCVYEIEGVEQFERTEIQIRLPATLTRKLLYDPYLTARGIWYAKTLGTVANVALLPFVDADALYNSMESLGDIEPEP